MDLRTLLRFLRASLRLIIGTAFIAVVVAVGASMIMPKSYVAHVKLIVGSSLGGTVTDFNQIQTALQLASTYAAAAETTTVAQVIIAGNQLDTTPDQFLHNLTTDVDRTSPILTITYQAATPDQAAAVATAVANYLITTQQAIAQQSDAGRQQIAAEIAQIGAQIDTLSKRVATLQAIPVPTQTDIDQLQNAESQILQLRQTQATLLTASANGATLNGLAVLDPALPPVDPDSPKPIINGIIGLIAGIAAGILLALSRRALDDTFQGDEDARRTLGVPVLASISRIEGADDAPIRRLVMFTAPRSPAAEAFRSLRTSLEFALPAGEPGVFLVGSAGTGEGKSVVAANLALAFAQAGRRTILVDANLRSPSQHDLFGTKNERGLTTLLQDEKLPVDAVLSRETHSDLRVITSGPLPENPAEQLGSRRAADVIAQLRQRAEVVIIDSAAAGTYTDPALVASLVDGVVLVVATGRTKQGRVPATIEAFARVGAKVVGVAINQIGSRAATGDPSSAAASTGKRAGTTRAAR